MGTRFCLLLMALLLVAGIALMAHATGTAPQTAIAQPVIEVEQHVPDHVEPGETISLEILVSNSGTSPAENLVITDVLPSGFEVVEVSHGPERKRGMIVWRVARLGPRERCTFRLVLRMMTAHVEVKNILNVTFQGSVEQSASLALMRPELVLQVTAPEWGFVNKVLNLQIHVTNKGTTAARNVVLHTMLPSGLAHPQGADLESVVGPIEPGQVRSFSLALTPTRPGELHTLIRAFTQGSLPVERDVVTRVRDVRLNVTANGPKVCCVNWSNTCDFTVANEGNEDAHQLQVVVKLPEGMSFVAASENATYDSTSHSIQWDLRGLRSGEKKTVVFNGIPRATGALDCRVLVTADETGPQQMTWSTKVVPASSPTLD